MTFIVAEIGINWDGSFKLLEEMMEKAKNAQVDMVKLQAFDKTIVKDHPESNRLLKSSVTENNIEQIDNISKTVGIKWFCTPMYNDAVEFLEPYVDRYKIREVDARDLLQNKTSLLLERIFKTNKEIIASTQKFPSELQREKNPKIKWLYCVPKYPCDFSALDFREIKKFEGYSNHTPHFIAPLTASVLGAEIIEIHITSDKKKNFIDNNVSFDYKELEELVSLIKLSQKIKKQKNHFYNH